MNTIRRVLILTTITLTLFAGIVANAQNTKRIYLSGVDAEHPNTWEFFCSAGNNSGKWTSIGVPSCWEQQGFGSYNYGRVPFEDRLKEYGLYKYHFTLPKEFRGKDIQIVFEGSMTDTEVKINGKSAGAKHQGAFYEFKYNITDLLQFGAQNLLEVRVDKHSSNHSVNEAERKSDYWTFGGIFRPVYLEVKPKTNIQRLAVDARANGEILADLWVKNGKNVSSVDIKIETKPSHIPGYTAREDVLTVNKSISDADVTNGEAGISKIRLSTALNGANKWSPEFPYLYDIHFTLKDKKGEEIHTFSQTIGFRTVEVKESDGIYVNGVKIKFKGVDRHTFHPDYARASSKRLSTEHVDLMKDMNMNSVRMSHYPPSKHFLEVCDSLGLFVIDELTGWQQPPYDEEVGRKLVKELIERDVNFPSVVLWANGNEGGWNYKLDKDFPLHDIQKREVIHPWQHWGKTNTYHYNSYEYLSLDGFAQRAIFFPTELLHGLYDGGHGAGLDDYWQKMWSEPLSAGGFLWNFADEAVARTDNGILDGYGNAAPDGIVGPYNEKEGSYYTIKEVWAPVFFEKKIITSGFNGKFNIENRYHYTSLNACTFEYAWMKLPAKDQLNSEVNKFGYRQYKGETIEAGKLNAPDLEPLDKGTLDVPLSQGWQNADVLLVKAFDYYGKEIFQWSWPVSKCNNHIPEDAKVSEQGVELKEDAETLSLSANGVSIVLSKETGKLLSVSGTKGHVPLTNGPVIVGGDRKVEGYSVDVQAGKVVVDFKSDSGNPIWTRDAAKNVVWTMTADGLVDLNVLYHPQYDESRLYRNVGLAFSFPEERVAGAGWMGLGPYRVWKNRMKGGEFGVWYKEYNNTVTGHSGFVYPEFKGFHGNVYWITIKMKDGKDFTVYSKTDDTFVKLFNPETPGTELERGTKVDFGEGDLAFLNGITGIGTKFLGPDKLGPQGSKYMFVYGKRRPEHGIRMHLVFDFR